MIVAFTGHRDYPHDLYAEALLERLRILCRENRDITFLCGMAVGFDLWAGECVARLRSEYQGVKLVAVIPYPGQTERFSLDYRVMYERIKSLADSSIVISDHYSVEVYSLRNNYLVDHADCIVSYYDATKSGGTAYTMKRAQRQHKPIYNIYQSPQLTLEL